MKKLIKNADGVVIELSAIESSFMPDGWSEVPTEELEVSALILARANKLQSIRSKRDEFLLKNDKLWLIAAKKGEVTTALETDAETLRDLPELAQTELDALETVEDVQAYDCFAGLALSGDYE